MRIRESDAQLTRILYGEFCRQINQRLSKALPKITAQVQSLVSHMLWQDPTTKELLDPSSRLVGVLGFPHDAAARVDDVINTVCKSLRVRAEEFRVIGRRIKGWIAVEVVRADYRDVLHLSSAIISDAQNQIPWLDMLLLQGDRLFSLEFSWLYRPAEVFKGSRSDHSLIIESPNARAVRVPPEFSGTRQRNWLTRAFTDNPEYFQRLEKIIVGAIM